MSRIFNVFDTLKLVALLLIFTAFGLFYRSEIFGIGVGALWLTVQTVTALIFIAAYRKNVSLKDVLVGLFFGLMCIPRGILKYPAVNTVYIMGIYFDVTILEYAIPLVPVYIASMAVFKNSEEKIYLFKNGKKHTVLKTVLWIVIAAAAWVFLETVRGVYNGVSPTFHISGVGVALGLQTGFFEEVFYRTFLFAVCVVVLRGRKMTRLQSVLCYAIMLIPHTLAHFTLGRLIYAPLFVVYMGIRLLPMAIAQRRNNLVSAIGIHMAVNTLLCAILGTIYVI